MMIIILEALNACGCVWAWRVQKHARAPFAFTEVLSAWVCISLSLSETTKRKALFPNRKCPNDHKKL
eukprot:1328613-Amphidinium_carterae.1